MKKPPPNKAPKKAKITPAKPKGVSSPPPKKKGEAGKCGDAMVGGGLPHTEDEEDRAWRAAEDRKMPKVNANSEAMQFYSKAVTPELLFTLYPDGRVEASEEVDYHL